MALQTIDDIFCLFFILLLVWGPVLVVLKVLLLTLNLSNSQGYVLCPVLKLGLTIYKANVLSLIWLKIQSWKRGWMNKLKIYLTLSLLAFPFFTSYQQFSGKVSFTKKSYWAQRYNSMQLTWVPSISSTSFHRAHCAWAQIGGRQSMWSTVRCGSTSPNNNNNKRR